MDIRKTQDLDENELPDQEEDEDEDEEEQYDIPEAQQQLLKDEVMGEIQDDDNIEDDYPDDMDERVMMHLQQDLINQAKNNN